MACTVLLLTCSQVSPNSLQQNKKGIKRTQGYDRMNKLDTRGLLYSSPRFFLKGTEAVLLPKPIPTTTRRMVGAGACRLWACCGRYAVRRVPWTSLQNADSWPASKCITASLEELLLQARGLKPKHWFCVRAHHEPFWSRRSCALSLGFGTWCPTHRPSLCPCRYSGNHRQLQKSCKN